MSLYTAIAESWAKRGAIRVAAFLEEAPFRKFVAKAVSAEGHVNAALARDSYRDFRIALRADLSATGGKLGEGMTERSSYLRAVREGFPRTPEGNAAYATFRKDFDSALNPAAAAERRATPVAERPAAPTPAAARRADANSERAARADSAEGRNNSADADSIRAGRASDATLTREQGAAIGSGNGFDNMGRGAEVAKKVTEYDKREGQIASLLTNVFSPEKKDKFLFDNYIELRDHLTENKQIIDGTGTIRVAEDGKIKVLENGNERDLKQGEGLISLLQQRASIDENGTIRYVHNINSGQLRELVRPKLLTQTDETIEPLIGVSLSAKNSVVLETADVKGIMDKLNARSQLDASGDVTIVRVAEDGTLTRVTGDEAKEAAEQWAKWKEEYKESLKDGITADTKILHDTFGNNSNAAFPKDAKIRPLVAADMGKWLRDPRNVISMEDFEWGINIPQAMKRPLAEGAEDKLRTALSKDPNVYLDAADEKALRTSLNDNLKRLKSSTERTEGVTGDNFIARIKDPYGTPPTTADYEALIVLPNRLKSPEARALFADVDKAIKDDVTLALDDTRSNAVRTDLIKLNRLIDSPKTHDGLTSEQLLERIKDPATKLDDMPTTSDYDKLVFLPNRLKSKEMRDLFADVDRAIKDDIAIVVDATRIDTVRTELMTRNRLRNSSDITPNMTSEELLERLKDPKTKPENLPTTSDYDALVLQKNRSKTPDARKANIDLTSKVNDLGTVYTTNGKLPTATFFAELTSTLRTPGIREDGTLLLVRSTDEIPGRTAKQEYKAPKDIYEALTKKEPITEGELRKLNDFYSRHFNSNRIEKDGAGIKLPRAGRSNIALDTIGATLEGAASTIQTGKRTRPTAAAAHEWRTGNVVTPGSNPLVAIGSAINAKPISTTAAALAGAFGLYTAVAAGGAALNPEQEGNTYGRFIVNVVDTPDSFGKGVSQTAENIVNKMTKEPKYREKVITTAFGQGVYEADASGNLTPASQQKMIEKLTDPNVNIGNPDIGDALIIYLNESLKLPVDTKPDVIITNLADRQKNQANKINEDRNLESINLANKMDTDQKAANDVLSSQLGLPPLQDGQKLDLTAAAQALSNTSENGTNTVELRAAQIYIARKAGIAKPEEATREQILTSVYQMNSAGAALAAPSDVRATFGASSPSSSSPAFKNAAQFETFITTNNALIGLNANQLPLVKKAWGEVAADGKMDKPEDRSAFEQRLKTIPGLDNAQISMVSEAAFSPAAF